MSNSTVNQNISTSNPETEKKSKLRRRRQKVIPQKKQNPEDGGIVSHSHKKTDQNTNNSDTNIQLGKEIRDNKRFNNRSKSVIKQASTNRPKLSPLLREVSSLLKKFSPITINGITVASLSLPPQQYIENILGDRTNKEEIFMSFLLKPSDPNFPYDLDFLKFTLCLPQTYPFKLPSPTIMVLNDDIPRGFSVNIEIGFRQIVATVLENRANRKSKGRNPKKEHKEHRKDKEDKEDKEEKEDKEDKEEKEDKVDKKVNTEECEDKEKNELKIEVIGGNDLVGMVLTLDKYLERLLSMEKKDTVKIVKVIGLKNGANEAREKEKKRKEQKKKIEHFTVDDARLKKRNEEIDRFRQRLRLNNIRLFKETSQNSIYKFDLFFKDENFTIEIEDSTEISIDKLAVKISIPMEYLSNPKKPLKMEIDMSNNYNLKLINSIEDTNVRLIFGKLINNINRNFENLALDVSTASCQGDAKVYWSITSQLNFFLGNILKFMNEKSEFLKWYDDNRLLNKTLA